MTSVHGNTKHGMSTVPGKSLSYRHKIYRTWLNMRQRCRNSNNPDYAYYGGRGISVCAEWDDFGVFMKDMGMPPNNMTIERLDVNGNYEPSNCVWATRKEQSRNTRATSMITYDGVTKPLADWADEIGMSFANLYKRIHTRGWDIDRALNQPERKRKSEY